MKKKVEPTKQGGIDFDATPKQAPTTVTLPPQTQLDWAPYVGHPRVGLTCSRCGTAWPCDASIREMQAMINSERQKIAQEKADAKR